MGLPEGVRSFGPVLPGPHAVYYLRSDPRGKGARSFRSVLSTLSHALLDIASPEAVRSEGNVVCLADDGRVTRSLALTHTLALLTSLTLGLLALINGRGEGAAACPSRP